jgi:hypothetical protein
MIPYIINETIEPYRIYIFLPFNNKYLKKYINNIKEK